MNYKKAKIQLEFVEDVVNSRVAYPSLEYYSSLQLPNIYSIITG